ncbi:hypothetical protein GCM10010313_81720 [Streptomyces violarus]|uniref:Uncharacterized protein n=1 Tax=Streptomyces violarus TaxID=67380 RepID=A0A7W4ZZK4_9ACTN|nr:hypothetical protein [Streptomyces violarus]MBB3081683.1 hypothetical protein [Streptomyces violarus]GHD34819.1 hypothetical protein GCM10010313_81720 [Streptomyces violarus]
MSFPPRPDGQETTALGDINDRIRRLMDQPADDQRSATYAELLAQWAEVTRDDVEPAA